jgi:hypothetical protein
VTQGRVVNQSGKYTTRREIVERWWVIRVFGAESGHCVVDDGVCRVAF